MAPGQSSRKPLSTSSITRIETVSAARAVRTAVRTSSPARRTPVNVEQVAEEEGQDDGQRQRGDGPPAPPGGQHHAQHLTDGTAGQAVQRRGDRGPPGSIHVAVTIYPQGYLPRRRDSHLSPPIALRCIGTARCAHARARPPRRPARGGGLRARAGPALRPVDRLLLARHPPADLPGAGADGAGRLGTGHRGRPDRPPRQEGVRRDPGRRGGAGRLAGRAHPDGAAAQRAGGEAARGVVRRPGAGARRRARHPRRAPRGWPTTNSSHDATTPTPRP